MRLRFAVGGFDDNVGSRVAVDMTWHIRRCFVYSCVQVPMFSGTCRPPAIQLMRCFRTYILRNHRSPNRGREAGSPSLGLLSILLLGSIGQAHEDGT